MTSSSHVYTILFSLAVFECAGVNLSAPLVAMCYNGFSASLVALAAAHLNKQNVAVYDVRRSSIFFTFTAPFWVFSFIFFAQNIYLGFGFGFYSSLR